MSDDAVDDASEIDALPAMGQPQSIDAPAALPGAASAAPEDAADKMPAATGDASTTCMSIGGGGVLGSGECEQSWGETCNGVNYQVDCSCPRGSCVCFGPTTHVVAYSGCPTCPGAGSGSVFALCGFPWGGP